MHIFMAYLAVAGGISAGLQVSRGVVRGTGRMLAGDPKGALAEVTAGVVAPVAQVYREVGKLTIDVFVAAQALTEDSPAADAMPSEDAWTHQRNGVAC
jgi:hypothetical protein